MTNSIEVLVPDIGGFKDVSVIEVLVKEGQKIDKETPLITLETEKAAMDVPAPAAGEVVSMKLRSGDKVSEGSLILELRVTTAVPVQPAADIGGGQTAAGTPTPPRAAATHAVPQATPATSTPRAAAPAPAAVPASAAAPAAVAGTAAAAAAPAGAAVDAAPRTLQRAAVDEKAFSRAYASPSVRKFARELGADLGSIKGSGPKARITQEDVKAAVKKILTTPRPTQSALPKVPEVDFALFGPVETKPLSRIQKISGARLQASWVNLPHVTHHDDADITDLDAARASLKDDAAREGVKLTPLVFIIKACIVALQKFPRLNASLDASGEKLVLKNYYNIGFAADTPNGLVVPVIRDADRRNVFEIARALGVLSTKARAGKLSVSDMQGGSFTVSSLGGIGGTAFTPIINAPEVAILGVSKSLYKPVYDNGNFVPRLMLPLSLSYDHRVVDGAEAARFVAFLGKTLGSLQGLL